MGRGKNGPTVGSHDGHEHFKVEMLDEAEEKAIATFTAPTQEAHVIRPGRYHVRISGPVNSARPRNWMQASAAITV